MLNGMSSEFAGRPVEGTKPVLRTRWRAVADGSITDLRLTKYAKRISAGTTFNVTVDELS